MPPVSLSAVAFATNTPCLFESPPSLQKLQFKLCDVPIVDGDDVLGTAGGTNDHVHLGAEDDVVARGGERRLPGTSTVCPSARKQVRRFSSQDACQPLTPRRA